MARYAQVQNSDGKVLNIIEWDGIANFDPGADNTMVAIGGAVCEPGMKYENNAFVSGAGPVLSRLTFYATSTLVVKKIDLTLDTWDELGVVTSTPEFFHPLSRMIGRVVGTVKSTGNGVELQVVEEKDDGTRTVLTPTPLAPAVNGNFKTFSGTTSVPPSKGTNRYILEGRLKDLQATGSVKGVSLSVLGLSPV